MATLVSLHSSRKLVIGLVFLLSTVGLIPLFVSVVEASPSTWSIETVDASESVGAGTSIALDSYGNPHISYYDLKYGNLKYARWTGSAWDVAAPLDDGDGAEVGSWSSIDIDSNDRPHISYIDFTNHALKYSMWNGTAWSIETIHTAAAAGQTSIALDSADHPHVSYIRETVGWLSYGVWGGMNWSFVSIDTSCYASYTSIAVDSLDRPHISYFDATNEDLKYARWTGAIWINETIDSGGRVGVTTSIALDSDDNPHISYYDSTNADLKYARWDGTNWIIETVDSSGNVGEYTSIALDSNDYPHICYYEAGSNWDLKYAHWTGSVWSIESVDTANAAGSYCSLALDSGDHPHISYWDNTNSNLKYARAPDEYFYSVYGTPLDSNSDGYSDGIQVNMDADTTYAGSLNVFVYAYLRDSLGNYVGFDDPLWSIASNAVEWGEAFLYLPADAQEGYYDVELFLFDADNNFEDYRLFEDEVYLYPSQFGWLQGTVRDLDTGLSMSADIYVNGTLETSTNATGQYSLELLAGDYEIMAQDWEGSLYNSQTIDATIVAGVITTQNFYLERKNWIISIQAEGSGDTDPSPGAYTWPKDTEFPVEALPDPSFQLLYWLLDSADIGNENPFPVFMDGNHNLTAVFAEEAQIGLLSGNVVDAVAHEPIGDAEVRVGSHSVFTDAAGNYEMELVAGYQSVTVQKSLYSSQTVSLTIVAGNGTVQDFSLERSHWTLTIESATGGATNLTQGLHVFPVGSEIAVEALPNSGWTFSGWLLDTVEVGSANPISVFMNADHVLKAAFEETPSPSPSPSSTPTPSPNEEPDSTPSPTPNNSPSPQPTPTPSVEPTPTASPLDSPTPSPEPQEGPPIALIAVGAAVALAFIGLIFFLIKKSRN